MTRAAFELDVLTCPRRMRLIATIEDPRLIRQILDHLGLPTEIPQPRPPSAQAADPFADIPA
ncbi:MAG: hypothetical protein ACE5JD_04620 [Candidatus Methylomirabilia bacterium]